MPRELKKRHFILFIRYVLNIAHRDSLSMREVLIISHFVQKATGFQKQKTNKKACCHPLNTPVINPRTQCAEPSNMKELKNQVCYLQNQLSEARNKNKQLERVNHRCAVALQHFQELEEILPQTLAQHENESRALNELLHEAHMSRDKVARELQSAKDTLHKAQDSLQHLEQLNQDHNFLEREKLTCKLEKVTAEVDMKNKRILDLEKNLQLSQASFSHHIEVQERKTNEARKTNIYLEQQIYYLRQKLQDKENKLIMHSMDYHRFLKGWNKKAREGMTDPENALPPPETELFFLRCWMCAWGCCSSKRSESFT
ncbi:lebercilin-like protein [Thalassophryne amazonica]|uniref:lebercilin-like protein n=1 Tax=Thalassophryne amazonica TaxID=390379 RepID=UPI0014722CEE|nr:lebercilin-like protein [Thalassophryne amazonica]